MNNGIDFGKDGIWKILFKLAPPVMAAQLIQALYNMVDSIFVGRYSEAGLTALSIIYTAFNDSGSRGNGRRYQHFNGTLSRNG